MKRFSRFTWGSCSSWLRDNLTIRFRALSWAWPGVFGSLGAGLSSSRWEKLVIAKEKSSYGISIAFHLILVSCIVYSVGIPVKSPSQGLYMVDIVAAYPSTGKDRDSGGMQDVESDVDEWNVKPKMLGGVEKENALPQYLPDNGSTKVEPLEDAQQEPQKESLPAPPDAAVSYSLSPATADHGKPGNPFGPINPTAFWKQQIMDLVEGNIMVPADALLDDRHPRTTCLLRISKMGELLEKEILVSSGNNLFDRFVLQTLDDVKRLPLPPRAMIAGQSSIEVTVSFSPPGGGD